jgi:hypothetical protein
MIIFATKFARSSSWVADLIESSVGLPELVNAQLAAAVRHNEVEKGSRFGFTTGSGCDRL